MLRCGFVKVVCVLTILIFLSGCVSSTKMVVNAVDPSGKPVIDATVLVNGENIGQTPNADKRISNFAGTETEITIFKDGYNTAKTEPVREAKSANIVFGIFNPFAFLWVSGPRIKQYFVLTPEQAEVL